MYKVFGFVQFYVKSIIMKTFDLGNFAGSNSRFHVKSVCQTNSLISTLRQCDREKRFFWFITSTDVFTRIESMLYSIVKVCRLQRDGYFLPHTIVPFPYYLHIGSKTFQTSCYLGSNFVILISYTRTCSTQTTHVKNNLFVSKAHTQCEIFPILLSRSPYQKFCEIIK